MTKRSAEDAAFRRQWIKDHPPDYRGTWPCRWCGNPVHRSEMELGHIKKRGSHPELRLDPNNVWPEHKICNQSH